MVCFLRPLDSNAPLRNANLRRICGGPITSRTGAVRQGRKAPVPWAWHRSAKLWGAELPAGGRLSSNGGALILPCTIRLGCDGPACWEGCGLSCPVRSHRSMPPPVAKPRRCSSSSRNDTRLPPQTTRTFPPPLPLEIPNRLPQRTRPIHHHSFVAVSSASHRSTLTNRAFLNHWSPSTRCSLQLQGGSGVISRTANGTSPACSPAKSWTVTSSSEVVA